MKILILLSLLFSLISNSFTEKKAVVFKSGDNGYSTYRIPAIISLPDGTLLAFAEGRVKSSDDFGNIDIVMKRSTDKGQTWGPMMVIADFDSLQAGNPAPVVDLTDPRFPGGRIFLFFNTGNNHEGEVRKGNGCREVWYKTSIDGGLTWLEAVNITTQVHRPLYPGFNPAYSFSDDWRSYANTPGHAMQFTEGRYKGRILVAANHSKGNPEGNWDDYAAHAFYTDDHGSSFNLSQVIPVPGSNEATAAEISNSSLILNARNQKGDIRARIVAISRNGGQTWDSVWFDKNLPDPVCEGTILSVRKNNGHYTLFFCNAADTARRDNLTLRISSDEGKTWRRSIPIDRSGTANPDNDFTAYSDLVAISSSKLGVLYERNNYNEIVFHIIKLR
jgi:sialidase-1